MHAELIEKSLKKHGSVRAIATAIDVDVSNLNKSFRAKKLPAYVADELAEDLGEDRETAIVEALMYAARSERERDQWRKRLLELMGMK